MSLSKHDELLELKSNLVALPDEELLRIITVDRDEYRQEALEFATQELGRRKIPVPPPVVGLRRPAVPQILVPVASELKHTLPQMWPGYLLAIGFLVAEIVEVINDPGASKRVTLVPVVIALGGWVYWIWCMRGVRKVIIAASGDLTLQMPSRASAFFGFHSLTWVYKWPGDVAGFVNSRLGASTINTRLPSLGLLAGILLSRVDAAIGLVIVFSVGTYLRRKLVTALGLGG